MWRFFVLSLRTVLCAARLRRTDYFVSVMLRILIFDDLGTRCESYLTNSTHGARFSPIQPICALPHGRVPPNREETSPAAQEAT